MIKSKWEIDWAAFGGDAETNLKEFTEDLLQEVESNGLCPPWTLEKSVLPGISDFVVNRWENETFQKSEKVKASS
jgi:hypothetical protein